MMRSLPLFAALFLAACQLASPERAAPKAAGLAVEAIAVTSLDAPQAASPGGDASVAPQDAVGSPASGPDAKAAEPLPAESAGAAELTPGLPEVQLAPETPESPKSPEQMLCEQSGGLWTVAGATGANLCVSATRDGGKACRNEGDCEGQCLARSRTCAPYAPLFGCNDVLDKDGRQMTLCLD